MDEFDAPVEKLEPVKPPRGCFFYGCMTALALSLVLMLVAGIAAFSIYRYYTRMVNQYTSTAPVPLPPVTLSDEEKTSLKERVDAFKKSLDTGKDIKPLVLTADEINAQIAENPDFANHVHVEIQGDKIQGQVSMPLDKIKLPGFSGRYLNGKATFAVLLTGGQLFVTLNALEVNGKPLPEETLQGFRNQNLAASFADDPDNAKAIAKLESIEVKNGTLIITPRAKTDEEDEKGEKADTPKALPKPDDSEGTSKPEAKDAEPAKPEAKDAEPATPKQD